MELDEPRASMRLQRTERGGEGREQWRTARAPVERPRGGSARGMWPAAAELAMVTNEAMRSYWIQMILKSQSATPHPYNRAWTERTESEYRTVSKYVSVLGQTLVQTKDRKSWSVLDGGTNLKSFFNGTDNPYPGTLVL